MVKLSVVIPCYLIKPELVDLTKSAIYSFRQAELPEWELVLVDDGSLLGSGYLKEEADTYIHHKKNQGFIKTVNDGINLARGELVAVANNDIRVAPNFYDVARDILEDPQIVSVHPRMLFYDDPIEYGIDTHATGKERWCQSSFFILKGKHLFPENYQGTGGAYEDWRYWTDLRDNEGYKTAYTTKTCFQHKDSSTTQIVGEKTKHHKDNAEVFKDEFGDYPENYFAKRYPEQMRVNWRDEFIKI